MKLKSTTLIISLLIIATILIITNISCQECDNAKNVPSTTYIEKYKYNKAPLIGHIDIFQLNELGCPILIEQIISYPKYQEKEKENKTNNESSEYKVPYIIKLDPGTYEIKLYDKIHHHTYTRYIQIGFKQNTE